MNTPIDETIKDGNQRKKSIGSGTKTRRHSIGPVTTNPKSLADEGNHIPNYLRASTGSCHDFCKYGHKHENSKSRVPIMFKRTKVVDKDKVIKTVVPVEPKRTTTLVKVKPSTDLKSQTPGQPIVVNKKDVSVSVPVKKAQVLKRSASTNGKETKSEPKMMERSTSFVRPSRVTTSSDGFNGGIKKKDLTTVKKTLSTPKTVAIKKVSTESQPNKSVFGKAASSKVIKHRSSKHVSPLKDQNRLQKANFKQNVADKVQTKNLHDVESESEIKPETVEFDFVHPDVDLSNLDNGIIHSATESFSGKFDVEQEFDDAESEIKPESLEFDSSQFGLDFNNSSSDYFLGKNFLEDESGAVESEVKPESEAFDLTRQDVDFIHSTSESLSGNNEEELFEAESKVKHEKMEFDFGKNVVDEELTILNPVNMNEELVEEPLITARVVESSHSCSDKDLIEDELLITAAVSESSESFYDEEVIIEDDYEYTDDDDDDVEVSEEEFESETANNDKQTSVVNQNKILKKGRMMMSEDKDDEGVKLRFRRGKILDVKCENNGPRRLKFRKGRITEGKNVNQRVGIRSFEKKYVEEKSEMNVASESVVLKHQGEQGKKDAQGLFNNVIEETASKLVETRKSKVKALVGAFETVISLQDGKP